MNKNIIELTHSKIENKSYYFIEVQNRLFKRISENKYYYLSCCGVPNGKPILKLKNNGTKLIQSFKLSDNDFNKLLKDYTLLK